MIVKNPIVNRQKIDTRMDVAERGWGWRQSSSHPPEVNTSTAEVASDRGHIDAHSGASLYCLPLSPVRLLTAALGTAGRADADRRGHSGAAPVEMEKLAGRTSTSDVNGSSRWSWPAWLLTSAALVLSSPSSAQDVTWTSLAHGIDVAVWTP